MSKLTAKYDYRRDGTKNIKAYLISLKKTEIEKMGFNKDTELQIKYETDKIVIQK